MANYMTSNMTDGKNETPINKESAANVPSGFVLKLYQMVNEAPDEIIAWLPSGDAFRISNLQRLENETLPTFFRHRRFQSLVRQLNFYNFRKVNRERTFWVYRHQLFHRDRPEELHLLRRRTCPGVDGRKQRSDHDSSSSRSQSPRPRLTATSTNHNSSSSSRRNYLSADDQSDESVALSLAKKKRKIGNSSSSETGGVKKLKRKIETSNSQSHNAHVQTNSNNNSNSNSTTMQKKESHVHAQQIINVGQPETVHEQDSPSTVIDADLLSHVVPPEGDEYKGPSGLPKRMVSPNIFGDGEKKERSNSFEQSLLVSRVARKLEEHARRAAAAKGMGAKRRSGTVTPPFSSDTMKYHALTYDDEIEIYDSERGCVVERQQRGMAGAGSNAHSNAAESDESYSVVSNDEEERTVSFQECPKVSSRPPVENNNLVSGIVRKLHGWARQSTSDSKIDGQLAAAIAGFCMMTNPRDGAFEDKCIQLMLACGSLVTEFRRYKTALLPGCLPTSDGLSSKTSPPIELQIKQLFNGDRNNTIRVFKVFLLNSLEDLVNDNSLATYVGLNSSECNCMNYSYQIWLKSLRHSS